jgi:hypothetical protein
MKRVFKSCAFWGAVMSCIIIVMHQIGQDSHNIMLIHFNPVLSVLERSSRDSFISGFRVPAGNLAGSMPIYLYIGSVITLAFYGGVIDLIRYIVRKKRKQRKDV